MSRKTVKLEDICVSISDGDHQAPPKVNKGIPFITISNIDNLNKIDFSNVMYVPDNYYDGLDTKRKPQKNDILYSVVGTFGKPVYIDNDDKFVFQRHIAILRPNLEKIVPKFLYHIMLSREFYAQADTLAIGAAQRTISLTALRKMKVDIPSLEMQNKITSILAKYDDLIANNNKRIKILEKMAENLYQEWFVRFRFPEYETAEFVDGVPKGWKREHIEYFYDTSSGGTPSRSNERNYIDGTIPWIKTGEIKDTIIVDTDEHITDLALKNSSAKLFPKDTVIMAMYGVNIGKLGYLGDNMACNQAACVFVDKSTINSKHYLFQLLKSMREYLLNIGFGAAQQNLSQQLINKIKITMPDKFILELFEDAIEPMYQSIKILNKQNQNLIKQRDYLLPRLMSGKLQVK